MPAWTPQHSEQNENHGARELNNQERQSRDARNTLAELALTLYQCPDGSLVNHPRECKEGSLQFTNIFG